MKYYIAILLFCFFSFLPAQTIPLNRRREIPVIANGQSRVNAWAGGLNAPQFHSFDLDKSGGMDLLVFDRADNSLTTYINRGHAGAPDFLYTPVYIDSFPEKDLFAWLIVKDYNGDGFPDLFTGNPASNIQVFINTMGSTGEIGFQPYPQPIKSAYPLLFLLYSSYIDIPAIYDVDGDGDLDFFTFDVAGSSVEFHKNISVENGWGLDSLRFALQSYCFGHFHENSFPCDVTLHDVPCAPGMGAGWKTTRHSGSTLCPLDLNSDGLMDFIAGDYGCNNLYALRNGGTAQIADFASMESQYPSNTQPVNFAGFIGAFFLDLDNDGIKDMVAAPNDGGGAENKKGVWWYRNAGNNSIPDFHFQDSSFLQKTMIETGSGSAPAFFDFDSDGLQDFIIGNLWAFKSSTLKPSGFSLFRNTGTLQAPSFSLWSDDYLGLATNPSFAALDLLTPTLGDLDNDGDADLLFGHNADSLYYFENIGNPGDTAKFVFVSKNYWGISAGTSLAPLLYDLDGDNDLDLVIGNRKGRLVYCQNTGNVSAPNFVKITDSLGLVKVNDISGSTATDGYSRPFFANTDMDPALELVVGTVTGKIYIWDNISPLPGATFLLTDSFPDDYGSYACIAGAVIDTSGEMTFLIGGNRGGLQLIGKELNIPIDREEEHFQSLSELKVFPNPADKSFAIGIPGFPANDKILFSLYDLTGRIVLSGTTANGEKSAVSEIQSGIYVIKAESATNRFTAKIIIRH